MAGWALFPDCDTRRSVVSTSLGCATGAFHHGMTTLAAVAYYATRAPADDPTRPVIHRGLTHTWPFALLVGALVALLCLVSPFWATSIILAISLHWALRGLVIPPPRSAKNSNLAGKYLTERGYTFMRLMPLPGKYVRTLGRSGTFALCLGTSLFAVGQTNELGIPWSLFLGLATGGGCLVHCLGDSVTEFGICWRYPFKHPVTGRRWQPIRFPKWFAFKAGRALETCVMWPALLFACVLTAPGGWALLGHMGEIGTAWRHTTALSAALTLTPWPTTKPASPSATLPAQ
jgi:membrane-bound metal-dependent hydrolase YbcI (DUF457 family)